jgi:hypothetical protein
VTQPVQVAEEAPKPFFLRIDGNERATVEHELRHVGRFSARSRTEVEDPLPRLGRQCEGRKTHDGLLDVKESEPVLEGLGHGARPADHPPIARDSSDAAKLEPLVFKARNHSFVRG